MKTIFDSKCKEELVKRINSLNDKNVAQWGKMNVYQMVKHCTMCDGLYLGKTKIKRVFIGRIIGKMILKMALEEGKPFGKGSPTSPMLITLNESGDLELQKKEWLNSIEQYSNFNNFDFIHPFFGPMTKEQIGIFVYKHTDHHLRQFGA